MKVTKSDESDPELVPVQVDAVRDVCISCAALEIAREELEIVLSPEALRGVSEAIVTEIDLVAASTRLGFGRRSSRSVCPRGGATLRAKSA